jgi:hypothetical protein
MPLRTIGVEFPFAQWGLDLIGPINLNVTSISTEHILY